MKNCENKSNDKGKAIKKRKPLTANATIMKLLDNEQPRVDVDYNRESHKLKFNFKFPKQIFENHTNGVATGVVELNINNRKRQNRCIYSDKIEHTLDCRNVCIMLAIEDDTFKDQKIIYGDKDVFCESDFVTKYPAVSLGALVYIEEHKFRIGLKLKEDTKLNKISIRWWAIKQNSSTVKDELRCIDNVKDEIAVSLEDVNIKIKRNQQYQFKSSVINCGNQEVTWRIVDDDGGYITQSGLYTAPKSQGVFKVEATSIEDFSKTATAFVIVKD